MRLVKYLAHCGVASRRKAEALIASGRVTVAGDVVTDPARDVDERSGVAFDGEEVRPEPHEVWALNKPLDVVSTAREPGARRAVTELVTSGRRLYPVGRLDADSTGLILLTNDGELANRLMHPRYEVLKTYRARVKGALKEGELRQLREGIDLDDHRTHPAAVRKLGESEVELTIHEGRKRQVRRMLDAVGHPVIDLERISMGPLRLDVEPGEFRELTPAEVERLWKNHRP